MVDQTGDNPWQILRGAGGAQALAVAARLDGPITSISPGPEIIGDIDLTKHYLADVEPEDVAADDPALDDVFFARKPQPVVIEAHGCDVLLLNNHLKSKFVNRGRQRWEAGGQERLEFIREALVARRRISAEAFRLRAYLDNLLMALPEAAVVVTGDLNDGPGADFFERQYLTHSVVDRVFGSIFFPERRLRHALFDRGVGDHTAELFDFVEGRRRLLVLDHMSSRRTAFRLAAARAAARRARCRVPRRRRCWP